MAVIPREWPVDAHWEAQFVDILRSAIPENWAVLWLDFQRDPRAPMEASSDIAQRMIVSLADGRTHAVWNGDEASEAFDLIAQCDACVAMRLHGVLLATASGVPTVAVEYDGKVSALCDEIGLDRTLRVPMDAFSSRLAGAIQTAAGTARTATTRAAELGERALAHRDLLHRAMKRVRGMARHTSDDRRWLESWVDGGTVEPVRALHAAFARLRRVPVVGDVNADAAMDAAAVRAAQSERDGAYRAALVANLDRDVAIGAREAAERDAHAAREESARLAAALTANESRSAWRDALREPVGAQESQESGDADRGRG